MTGTEVTVGAESVANELATIAETRRTDPSAYWRNDAMIARERELIGGDGRSYARPGKPGVNDLAAIAKLRRENPAAYYSDAALLRRERELIAKRDGLPEAAADAWRRTPEDARARFDSALVTEWESRGGFAVNLSRAQDMVALAVGSIGDETAGRAFMDSFDRLPAGVQTAIYREAASTTFVSTMPATDDDLAVFGSFPGGTEALRAWGDKARRNLAVAMVRYERCVSTMSASDRPAFLRWWHGLPQRGRLSLMWTLGSSDEMRGRI
jgi:hypothetical protein